jgi:hypothetical protein
VERGAARHVFVSLNVTDGPAGLDAAKGLPEIAGLPGLFLPVKAEDLLEVGALNRFGRGAAALAAWSFCIVSGEGRCGKRPFFRHRRVWLEARRRKSFPARP